jgi:hypothetical protein
MRVIVWIGSNTTCPSDYSLVRKSRGEVCIDPNFPFAKKKDVVIAWDDTGSADYNVNVGPWITASTIQQDLAY